MNNKLTGTFLCSNVVQLVQDADKYKADQWYSQGVEVHMKNEIKRNNWSRFFKKFNSANQFRRTSVSLQGAGNGADQIDIGPFLGLALSKKGRLIDGIQVLNGGWNAENVAAPAVIIKDPDKIWLEKDKDGQDFKLRLRSKDGTEAWLELNGRPQTGQQRELVEKVAYSMYERRGYSHGNDMADWYEAEQRVKEVEMELTS